LVTLAIFTGQVFYLLSETTEATPQKIKRSITMTNTTTINTKHNVDKETKIPEREIDLPRPKLLQATTIKELVKILGEEMVFNDLMSAIEVKFRAKIRALLASANDQGEYTFSQEAIKAMDFIDWLPETKIRMSAEEKVLKNLEGMTPDQIKAILAAATARLQ
jgi:hypothetical protein